MSNARRLIVSASAGSGKTSVLAHRYVEFVRRGYSPYNILTITFTKAAAAEMKRRIVGLLREGFSPDIVQAAESGPIQTIHSFGEQVLRMNSFAVGLDPKFRLESTGSMVQWVRSALREAIMSEVAETEDCASLIERLVTMSTFTLSASYDVLFDLLGKLLEHLRLSGFSPEWFRTHYGTPQNTLATYEGLLLDQLPPEAAIFFHQSGLPGFRARLKDAAERTVGNLPAWLKNQAGDGEDELIARDTSAAINLALEAWERLLDLFQQQSVVDFSELETRCVLLGERDPEVADRLRTAFPVVMVDEAQDLNPWQDRLLRVFDAEYETRVGDYQQSIYGFRDTRPDLFTGLMKNYETIFLQQNYRSDPGVLSFIDQHFQALWTDYRPMSIRAAEDPDDPFVTGSFPLAAEVELWEGSRESRDLANAILELRERIPAEEPITVLGRNRGNYNQLEPLLQVPGVQVISHGKRNYFAQLEVRDLANMLDALADPYDTVALAATLQSPIVGLTRDGFLTATQNVCPPTSSGGAALIERLQQPLDLAPADAIRLRAFLDWFQGLSRSASQMPAWEVIAEIFALSPFLAGLLRATPDGTTVLNARKLLSLAAKEPSKGPREFAMQIRAIQSLRGDEEVAGAEQAQPNTIDLRTFHSAKGLEFPYVVVLGLAWSSPSSPNLYRDANGTFAVTLSSPNAAMTKFMHQRLTEQERAEHERLLYVAFTRAMRGLYIHLPNPTNRSSVDPRIRSACISIPGVIRRTLGQLPPSAT